MRKYGIKFGIDQSKDLIEHGYRFIHYYTMNLETSVIKIIEGANIVDRSRALPFVKPTAEYRKEETVRPIFWSNNPTNYIQ